MLRRKKNGGEQKVKQINSKEGPATRKYQPAQNAQESTIQ
jgi:hypothetical protein